MTYTGQAKSIEDALAHYGVKGMRWGVRKKVTAADIADARINLASKQLKVAKAQQKVKATQRGTVERAKAVAKREEAKKEFLKDPDRVNAMRFTRGETVAIALLGGPVGLTVIASQAAQVRTVARKQAKGAYDK